MEGDNDVPVEPLFRANKRRKVFRKRTEADEDDDALSSTERTSNGRGNLTALGQDDGEEDEDPAGALQRIRRPTARKHGVAFSSTSRSQPQQELEASEDAALAIMHPSREQNMVAGADRFVKPTGPTVVEDDKHMTAFIDSKLAEMRSAAPDVNSQINSNTLGPATAIANEREREELVEAEKAATAKSHSRRHQQRPKRPPPARDAKDVARASLVDQIMQESAVPLYDRSASGTPSAPVNAASAGNDEADNEAAAAEAFKQQFLQDMEEQNRKRPPAPIPFSKVAAAKGPDRTAHGPKLGGSRQQRERHKAAEAAAKAIEQKK